MYSSSSSSNDDSGNELYEIYIDIDVFTAASVGNLASVKELLKEGVGFLMCLKPEWMKEGYGRKEGEGDACEVPRVG